MENLVKKYFGAQLEKAVPYDGIPDRREGETDEAFKKRMIDREPFIGQKSVFYLHETPNVSLTVLKLWESQLDEFVATHKFVRFAAPEIPSFSA